MRAPPILCVMYLILGSVAIGDKPSESDWITDHSLCPYANVACNSVAPITVRFVMGDGDAQILGAQFVVSFDPTALDLIDVVPGRECDPASPFDVEINEDVDTTDGSISYAAGVNFVGGGTASTGPDTIACAYFAPLAATTSQVCILEGENPTESMFVDVFGQPAPVNNTIDCPTKLSPPILACATVTVVDDCLCHEDGFDCDALSTDCRRGVCDESTGRCEVEFINEGEVCDDGNPCTENDRCIVGRCIGFKCKDPSLCVDSGGCVGVGLPNTIRIRMGETDRIITGAQFSIQYDPTRFEFVSIEPGRTCDSYSPFDFEIFRQVDEVQGLIFYAVGVTPGGQPGTTGPATLACLTLISLQQDPGEACLIDQLNPFTTLLVDDHGKFVGIDNTFDCPTPPNDPSVSCDDVCTIPTTSTWGIIVLVIAIAILGKVLRAPRNPHTP